MSQESTETALFEIHIRDSLSSIRVQTGPEENLLAALNRQGIPVRKACDNGVCGVCLTKLHQGDIHYGLREPFGLNQKEIAQGYILPCIAQCQSDIEIDEPPAPRKKPNAP